MAPGTDHTVLGDEQLYTQEVDGSSLIEWLTAFVAGEEGDDVHCTDCERPA